MSTGEYGASRLAHRVHTHTPIVYTHAVSELEHNQDDAGANQSKWAIRHDYPKEGSTTFIIVDNGKGMINASSILNPSTHSRTSDESIGGKGVGAFISMLSLKPARMTVTTRPKSGEQIATQLIVNPAAMITKVKNRYAIDGDVKLSKIIEDKYIIRGLTEDTQELRRIVDWGKDAKIGIDEVDQFIEQIEIGNMSGTVIQMIWDNESLCPFEADDPWKPIIKKWKYERKFADNISISFYNNNDTVELGSHVPFNGIGEFVPLNLPIVLCENNNTNKHVFVHMCGKILKLRDNPTCDGPICTQEFYDDAIQASETTTNLTFRTCLVSQTFVDTQARELDLCKFDLKKPVIETSKVILGIGSIQYSAELSSLSYLKCPEPFNPRSSFIIPKSEYKRFGVTGNKSTPNLKAPEKGEGVDNLLKHLIKPLYKYGRYKFKKYSSKKLCCLRRSDANKIIKEGICTEDDMNTFEKELFKVIVYSNTRGTCNQIPPSIKKLILTDDNPAAASNIETTSYEDVTEDEYVTEDEDEYVTDDEDVTVDEDATEDESHHSSSGNRWH